MPTSFGFQAQVMHLTLLAKIGSAKNLSHIKTPISSGVQAYDMHLTLLAKIGSS